MKGWGCLNIVKSRSYSLESHLKTLDSQKFFCIEMLRSQLFVGLSLQEVLVLKSVRCYNAVMELEEDMGKNCMFQGWMKKKISHPILANTFQGTATRYQEKKPRELSDDYCTCHEEILCQIHSALPFHSPLPQSSPEQNAWSFAISKRFGRLGLDGHNLNGRRWQKQRVESHQREVCECFQ